MIRQFRRVISRAVVQWLSDVNIDLIDVDAYLGTLQTLRPLDHRITEIRDKIQEVLKTINIMDSESE